MLDFSYGQQIYLKQSQTITAGDDILMTNPDTVDSFIEIGIGYSSHPGTDKFRTYADLDIRDLFLYTKVVIDLDSIVQILGQEYEVKNVDKYQMLEGQVNRYLLRYFS